MRHLQHGHAMMKTISVLALGALAVGCHLDKLLTGSGGGPRPTSHAPPAGLRFATQPPQSASVSQLIRVDVSVVDSAGVLVAGAETVMVVVALDAGSVSLGGTTTAHPVRGVASFPDLSVNQAGTYRLVASLFEFEPLGGIEVKGKSDPVTVYRVLSARRAPGSSRGLRAYGIATPLIGRAWRDHCRGPAQLDGVLGDLHADSTHYRRSHRDDEHVGLGPRSRRLHGYRGRGQQPTDRA